MRIEGWNRDVSILHFLGGSSIDVAGDRAIAQTKMTISQRGTVDGVLCDIVCTGRFYDFMEKRRAESAPMRGRAESAPMRGRAEGAPMGGDGKWGVRLRQPIYEKDRLDPVDPGARLELDQELLRQFPEGYRHLAYIQTRIGYTVKRDMPGLKGPEVEALYARGRDWLAGKPL